MAALHQRLHFDAEHGRVLDGPRRYLLLRADVLMGLFDALPGAARDDALRAFGVSVTRRGGDSVRAYASDVGRAQLLGAMQDAAASLGWGRWHFEADDDVLRLEVLDSPFAAAATRRDGAACHAIAGMLRAVALALWSEGAQARELSCAAQCAAGGPTVCRFEARRNSLPLTTHQETNP